MLVAYPLFDENMEKHLSPKQVARAIGVSESSLKRWCDQGLLNVVRTSGGHRRLPLSNVLEFVRQRQFTVSHPELLGLPPIRGLGVRVVDHARNEFFAALADGQEAVARQILFELYLSGAEVASLCDNFLAAAQRHFEELHSRSQCELYRVRRAEQILWGSLYDLQVVARECDATAPRALGATLAPVPAPLAAKMVELILRKAGWQATSLGSALTLPSLQAAIQELQPRLFWLSVVPADDPNAVNCAIDTLRQAAIAVGTQLVISGSDVLENSVLQSRGVIGCAGLQQWESLLANGTIRAN